MDITPVLVDPNNLTYFVSTGEKTICIDPIDPPLVAAYLATAGTPGVANKIFSTQEVQALDKGTKELVLCLTTHHHKDHSRGNAEILSKYPSATVATGSEAAPNNKVLKENEVINVENIKITCLHTPCHTSDSYCFLFECNSESVLFSGDTIHYMGCGRFFEGTPEEMVAAIERLKALPDRTLFYYGHDYRKNNRAFAARYIDNTGLPFDPPFLTLGQEKKYNVFFNLEVLEEGTCDREKMKRLRDLKDLTL